MNIVPPIIRKRQKNRSLIETKNSTPLPILFSPSDRVSGNGQSYKIFKAKFENGIITCEDMEEADYLWHNGYFGKGSLSYHGLRMKFLNYGREIDNEESGFTDSAEEICLMKEVLRLGFEESLFLSYGLGVLVVTNDKGIEMNIDMMWSEFYHIDVSFPLRYTVYHHFRSKGWIVKPGLKFGADFMLYPGGPPQYHSQFLVWIEIAWEDTLETDETFTSRMSDIADIAALDRLSSQTGKNLLICHVIRPRVLTDEDLKSIDCVKQFKISDTVLKRWIVGSDADGSEKISVPESASKSDSTSNTFADGSDKMHSES